MSNSQKSKPKRPILVIEDDPAQLKMLANILQLEGLGPICCQTGQEALAALEEGAVNVAILDLHLPDTDGVELLKQLKAHNPQLKVIINTGYPSLDSAMAAVNHEAFAYVKKMDDVGGLLAHVHRAFHEHLADHNEILAAEVKRRTEDLLKANQELKREIFEREQVEAALREREGRYRTLFENSPISLSELDLSEIKTDLEKLRSQGVRDFRTYFKEHPEIIVQYAAMVKYIDINQAALELYQASDLEELDGDFNRIFVEESYVTFTEELVAIAEGKTRFETEAVNQTLGGNKKYIALRWSVPARYEQTFSKVLVSIIDVTEQKKAEQTLRDRAQEMEALYETSLEISSQPDLPALLQEIVRRATSLLGTRGGALFLFDFDEGILRLVAGHNHSFPRLDQTLQLGEGLTGQVAQTGEPLMLTDYQQWDERLTILQNPTGRVLGVPLKRGERVIGVLNVFDRQPGVFGDDEIRLLNSFAAQAAIAIENTRLFEAEREQRLLTETLAEVTLALTSQTSNSAVLDEILHQVQRLVPYRTANIMLLDGDVLYVAGWQGYETGEGEELISGLVQPLNEFPIEAQIVQSRQPYVIPDTQDEPRWVLLEETAWIKSNLSVPICWYDRVLGILRLDSHIPAEFSEADAERLKPLANAAAIALENARLYEQARQEIAERKQAEKSLARRAAAMAALYETSLEINAQLDLTTLLQAIVKRASTLVGTQMGGLFLKQSDGETLELVVSHNQPAEILGIRLKLGEGLAGHIAQTGEPMTVSDYYHWSGRADNSNARIIGRILGVPLKQSEQIIGVINVFDTKPGTFDQEQTRLLSLFAAQASTAIANARLFDETFRRAQQLTVLNELARDMTGVLDAQDLCDTVVRRMSSNFDYLNVAVMTIDPAADELVMQAIAGEYAEKIQPGQYRQPIGQGIIGQAVATGESILVDARQSHPDFYSLPQTKVRSELAIPLTVGQHTMGVLVVSSEHHNTFDDSDIAAITTVADQLAIALEKVRLFDETRRRAEQLEALRQVSQDLSALRDLDTLLYQIVQRAMHLLGGDTGGIYLHRPERDLLEWVVAIGDDVPAVGLTLSRGEGVSGKVWDTGESLIVEDYRQWSGKSPKLSDLSATAVIGVPIQWGDEFLGVLIQGDRDQRHYTAEDARLMSQFATQAAIAIRNAHFYAETQRRLKEQTALRKAGEVISSTLDLQTVLDHMAEQLARTVDATSAYICSLELDTMTYTVLAEYIGPEACPKERISDLGVIYNLQQNFQTDMSLLRLGQFKIAHLDDEDLTEAGKEHFRRFGAQSILFLPMQMGGQTIAFAELWESRHRREFTSEDIALCQAIAQQAAIAMENARLHQKTEKQARQVERILNTVQDGILLLDAEHFIKLANPAAQTYLRLLADIGVGEVLTHIGEQPLNAILDSRDNGHWHEISADDDRQTLFEVAAQPVQIGPETEGWVIILRDVTEERQIQEQIQQQDRLAAVGQLAAGIAHDFNNILTSMIGYAELIRLDSTISEIMSKDLGLIIQQGERAAHLIRQILDFSRRSIIEKRPLDLSIFLKETVKLLERTIPEAVRIHLLIEADREVYMLRADPGQIQQALTNLAVNARDAMPDGGELKFRLSCLKLDSEDHSPYPDLTPDEWLVLSIADTGTGIKPEYLNHIFEPFFTTKDVGEGTGLGLAQVYGIVKQHDGHITVESQPGLGTTFTLYFPALPTFTRTSFPQLPVEVPHGQGEVILLVEDDAVVLEVTESMLQTLGYQVLSATNGREALQMFDRHQDEIALVLTDVTMPELGGIALAQALQERSSTIKIVALTGYPLQIEAEHSLAAGIIDWLQKPLSLKQLAQTVNRSLN